MIYLFTGSDDNKVRKNAFAWVAKAREKEPNVVYVRLAREELTDVALEEITSAGGLFTRRLLVLLDNPYGIADEGRTKSIMLDDHLDTLAASDNAILILAPKLAAPKRKKIDALAKMSYVFDTTARREASRGFNAQLVNALATRSREKLWLEVVRALRAGDAPEMLHGLLHWEARALMEKNVRAWSPAEARALSISLITLLQRSRRSGIALPIALERWALSV